MTKQDTPFPTLKSREALDNAQVAGTMTQKDATASSLGSTDASATEEGAPPAEAAAPTPEQCLTTLNSAAEEMGLSSQEIVVLRSLQKRREELTHLMDATEEAPVLFHPNMAKHYHKEVRGLIESLNDPATRLEAGTILRSLVERIVLTPREDGKGLAIDLFGDLAGILSMATKRGRPAIENELSRLQPTKQSCDEGANGEPRTLMAVVAGKRARYANSDAENSEAADPTLMAMVAGERSRHSCVYTEITDPVASSVFPTFAKTTKALISQGSRSLTAMGAGAGFEPAAFRL